MFLEREGGEPPKSFTIADFAEDDDSQDGSFVDNNKEDIELGEEETAGSGDEEVINKETNIVQTPRKMPPKKKLAAASFDDITKGMAKVAIGKNVSPTFQCPFMVYPYVQNGLDVCTVTLFIPSIHRRFVRLKVSESGKSLEVSFVLPSIFYDKHRIQTSEGTDDGTFNTNTHKATSFQKACEEMENLADINDQVVGDPMVVPLPFQCQATFFKDPHDGDDEGWGIEIFDNPDQILKTELEGDVDFFFMNVALVSVKKPKEKKAKGKMRRVTSPAPKNGGDDNDEENMFDE